MLSVLITKHLLSPRLESCFKKKAGWLQAGQINFQVQQPIQDWPWFLRVTTLEHKEVWCLGSMSHELVFLGTLWDSFFPLLSSAFQEWWPSLLLKAADLLLMATEDMISNVNYYFSLYLPHLKPRTLLLVRGCYLLKPTSLSLAIVQTSVTSAAAVLCFQKVSLTVLMFSFL